MEPLVRLLIFLSCFLFLFFLEKIQPQKEFKYNRQDRWPINLSLGALNVVLSRLLMGAFLYHLALFSESYSIGLFHHISFTSELSLILSLVVLDLGIYWQHVASHRWSWFWRIHRVHHTDLDLDVTSAVRFHPVEILLSMIFKGLLILLLGAPVLAVIIFEVILSSCALFNHSNVKIPLWLESLLRIFLVTPRMHRIHHSVVEEEANSHYGFSVSLWDYLFQTARFNVKNEEEEICLGLEEFRDNEELGLKVLLNLPFKRH